MANIDKDKVQEQIVLIDDDGNEQIFDFVDAFEFEDEKFAILAPVDNTDDETEEVVLLQVEEDENQELLLIDIEDEEKWEKVVDEWERIIETEND